MNILLGRLVLLGCLLTWCYFVLLAPGRLTSSAVLAFGGLALAFVLAGRMLARASLLRLVSPERVLLIGTGDTSGPFIELMRARPRRFKPIGVVTTAEGANRTTSLRRLGSLEEIGDLPRLLLKQRIGRVEFQRPANALDTDIRAPDG